MQGGDAVILLNEVVVHHQRVADEEVREVTGQLLVKACACENTPRS